MDTVNNIEKKTHLAKRNLTSFLLVLVLVKQSSDATQAMTIFICILMSFHVLTVQPTSYGIFYFDRALHVNVLYNLLLLCHLATSIKQCYRVLSVHVFLRCKHVGYHGYCAIEVRG